MKPCKIAGQRAHHAQWSEILPPDDQDAGQKESPKDGSNGDDEIRFLHGGHLFEWMPAEAGGLFKQFAFRRDRDNAVHPCQRAIFLRHARCNRIDRKRTLTFLSFAF